MKKFISVLVICLMSCLLITGMFSGVAIAAGTEDTYSLELNYDSGIGNPIIWTIQYRNLSTDEKNPTPLVMPVRTPNGLNIEGIYTDNTYSTKFDPVQFVKDVVASKVDVNSPTVLHVYVPKCVNYHYDTHTEVKWVTEAELAPKDVTTYKWYDSKGTEISDWNVFKNSTEDVDVYAKKNDPSVLTDFYDIVPVKPEIINRQKNYYRIKSSVDIIDGFRVPVSAMQKWKWVNDNISLVDQDSKAVVLIEEDLDFKEYGQLKSLTFGTVDHAIKFSIEGGMYQEADRVVKPARMKIKNFILDVNNGNNAFISKLNGGTISNLDFVNFKMTNTDEILDVVGGVVGVMQSGKISKVTLEKDDTAEGYCSIDVNSKVIGGLVGELVNGEISNCDVKVDISSRYNEIGEQGNVGGLVGNIIMGQLLNGKNQINEINIHDAYYIGAIAIHNDSNVGGIIGNIGFRSYNYGSNVANITVKDVYSKITKYTTAEDNTKEPFGILGNIVLKSGIILPDKPFVPGPDAKDPTLLPIEGIKFVSIISQDKVSTKVGASEPTSKKLNSFPKEFLSTNKVSKNRTIAEDKYGDIQSYSGIFDNSIWTMPDGFDHYELKYKYDEHLEKIKVSIGSDITIKSTSTILEKNNNDEVIFINGQPIVMTVVAQDGVHVERITAKIYDKQNSKDITIVIYDVNKGTPTPTGTIDDYTITNDNITFDYRNSKLIIDFDKDKGVYKIGSVDNIFATYEKVNVGMVPKYDVNINFEFSKEVIDNSNPPKSHFELAYNEYDATLETYKYYDINDSAATKEQLDFIKTDVETKSLIYIQPEKTMIEYKGGAKTINHNEILNIFILEDAIKDNVLSNVIVRSEAGTEALEMKNSKGWIKKNNEKIQIGTEIVNGEEKAIFKWAERYEVRLCFLNKPLHHKEKITIELLFKGRPVNISDEKAIRIQDNNEIDLIHNSLVDAKFLTVKDQFNSATQYIENGDEVQLAFKLTENAVDSKWVLNLLNGKKISIYNSNKVYANEEDKLKEILFDETNKYFYTKESFKMYTGTIVKLDLIKTKQVKIKEVIGTYLPPNFTIDNIPIIDADSASVDSLVEEATIQYNEEPLIDGVKDTLGIFTKQTNNSYEFTTLVNMKHNINIVKDPVYEKIEGLYINQEFKKGINSFTIDENSNYETTVDVKYQVPKRKIIINYKVKDKILTNADQKGVDPIYKYDYIDIPNSSVELEYEYGSKKAISRIDYVSDYEYDFQFDGWKLNTMEGDLVDAKTLLVLSKFVSFDKANPENYDGNKYKDYTINVILQPYYWLTVRSQDVRKGRIIYGAADRADQEKIYFTEDQFAAALQGFYVKPTSNKYLVAYDKIEEVNQLFNKNEPMDPNDNGEWPLHINGLYKINEENNNKEWNEPWVEPTYTNYKEGKLKYELVVYFNEKTVKGDIEFKAVDENNHPLDITIINKDEKETPTEQLANQEKLEVLVSIRDSKGDSIIDTKTILENITNGFKYTFDKLIYEESFTIIVEVPKEYDISWTRDGFDKIDGVNTYQRAEKRVSSVTIKDNITDLHLGVKFEKQQKHTYYTIGSIPIKVHKGVDEEGNDVYEDARLSDVYFKYQFGSTSDEKNKIKAGGDITITANVRNEIYDIEGWELVTYKVDIVDIDDKKVKNVTIIETITKNSPYFNITGIDGNYNLSEDQMTSSTKNYGIRLILKEKKCTVKISVPFKGIKLNIHIGKLSDEEFISDDTLMKEITFVYGTNIVIDFDDNEDYQFVKWDNLTLYRDITTKSYDMGNVKMNQNVNLVMRTYEAPEIDDTNKPITEILVNAHMYYDDVNARTGKVVSRFGQDGKVELSAKPDLDSNFAKWMVKENGVWKEYSTEADIIVPNAKSEYAALFTVKQINLSFGNGDVVKVAGKQQTDYGTTITLEANAKPGYTVDKVIVNGGEKVIVLGNVKKFTLYNVKEDQNISFVYRQVGETPEDSQAKDNILIMIIATVIIAVVVAIASKHIIKKTGTGKKHRKIKINID